MMLYEKNKDRKKFFKKVAKAIGQSDDEDELEDSETKIGGDLDLDEVLPPSAGHTVGERVPTNSNQTEDLENKLCAILLEKLGTSPTNSPVGVKGRIKKLGHSNPNVDSNTGAGASRDETDDYDEDRDSEETKKKKKNDESKGDAIDQLAAEMGMD